MSDKQRKILVIDDSMTNLTLLKAHLGNMGLVPLLASNAIEGINIAIEQKPDVILLDVMMPDIDGFETCRRLKADTRTSSIPIIFVSAKDQSEDKISGLKLGAIDYVTKPFNKGELQARIGIVLKMIDLQEKLFLQANTDELTQLANRRHFFQMLDYELRQAKIRGGSIAVMMFDVDHFKKFNDTYGHLSGDKILQQVGKILKESIYPMDMAARYGGEEFVIMMPGMPVEIATQRANKLIKIIDESHWEVDGKEISVTCSAGVAVFDGGDKADPYELIRRADNALYTAKNRGRNCVVPYSAIDKQEVVTTHESSDFQELQSKISTLAMQVKQQTLGIVQSFTKAIVGKDPYHAIHMDNVKIYVQAIARKMEVSQILIEQLGVCATLHDLGKIVIPNEILHKLQQLSEEEMRIMQRHPIVSAEILSPIGVFNQEIVIIRHHHENFDGTGYPNGLVGKNIPIGARILAVANVFDAMTSAKPWNPNPKSGDESLKEIVSLSGSQFDPEVVDAFKKVYEENKTAWPLTQKQPIDSMALSV
ncbi:MAG: diguanylate cyclase [Planctomycetaceae bacterium]|nr:diguanylate cyclase [Planctomycetaceae bacterium]